MPPQDGSPTHGTGGSTAVAERHASNGQGQASVPVDWERLARATAHPLRVSILEIFGIDGGRRLSPSDLSHELQIPLSNTNYHVTELAKSGLIELVDQRQVRAQPSQQLERLVAGARLGDHARPPVAVELQADALPHHVVVVGHDAGRLCGARGARRHGVELGDV